jgi:hypothetical protein
MVQIVGNLEWELLKNVEIRKSIYARITNTKRNETERNETKSNETKRNRSKRNETNSNETKRNDVTFRFVSI